MVSTDIELGGNKFILARLPGMRTFILQPLIAPAVTEIFAVLYPLANGTFDIDNIDVENLLPVIGRFFGKLPPNDLKQVVRGLLADCTMDGKPLFSDSGDLFDIFMMGRTMDTWRLLWRSVQLNYPDFFSLLGAKKSAKPEGEKPKSSSTSAT